MPVSKGESCMPVSKGESCMPVRCCGVREGRWCVGYRWCVEYRWCVGYRLWRGCSCSYLFYGPPAQQTPHSPPLPHCLPSLLAPLPPPHPRRARTSLLSQAPDHRTETDLGVLDEYLAATEAFSGLTRKCVQPPGPQVCMSARVAVAGCSRQIH